eukprot:864729-Prorocentrum_minimum.AAC.1
MPPAGARPPGTGGPPTHSIAMPAGVPPSSGYAPGHAGPSCPLKAGGSGRIRGIRHSHAAALVTGIVSPSPRGSAAAQRR